jgi:hypothetical protein
MALRLNLVHLAWEGVAGATSYDILLNNVKVSQAGPRARTTRITVPEGAEHKVTIKAQPSGMVQEAKFEWASLVTPPPSSLYFNGDFETGNLSQFVDFHDAHLTGSPPGVQIHAPGFSSFYCARLNILDRPDSSVYGDLAMLWDGDGNNSYQLPYLQEGQTTWFRLQILFPDGTDPQYPGNVWPAAGSFGIFYTWHTNPYVVPTAYSTYIGLHGGNGIKGASGDPISILFRPVGGAGEGTFTYLYHTNGAPQAQENRVPVVWNHWYDIVARITFGKTAVTGSVEWYVDGVAQTGANCPTIAIAGDGSVPGVGHEAGYYRGPTKPGTEVVYIDGMRAGPSRASVEA